MVPTPDRIYDAAIRLFGERGYAGTSMRDISDAVGILPGSLYTHINSKEAVLFDIVESGITKYLDAIRPCVDQDAPADERLAATIRAYVDVLSGNLEQTVIAFNQWRHLSDDADRKRIVKMRNEYEELFTTLIEDGIASGRFRPLADPKLTVFAIIGLLNAVPQWYSPKSKRPREAVADALIELVLSGLRPNGAAVDRRRSKN